MNWINPPENTEAYFGFVYQITCIPTGKIYIGKKQFQSLKTLPPLAGKTRKRKIYSESNWKEYTSSSTHVNSDINKLGKDNFKFEIIHLAKTRGDLSYLEAKEQWKYLVLENTDKFYNRQIAGIKWIPKLT